ncbi:MAG: hypothetical protein E7455_04800 [Ruminococcaceae bacterium]|nr:hypothetical protein [Oscillospiraceae bacterium]
MNYLTHGTKRCIAMVLAVVMVLSLMPVVPVSLANATETQGDSVNLSDLLVMDENYGGKLSDLQQIITSGMLKAEKEITYNQPEEGIIEVDSASKTITAHKSNGWIPASAQIKVGDVVKEDVVLNDGVGTYTYSGNAFSVVVNYELYVDVAAADQLALMNAAYYLVQDIATVACLRDGTVEMILSTLTSEMEELKDVEGIELDGATAVDLINQLATTGIELPALTLGGKTTTLKFLDIVSESIDDAAALLADKNDDGVLDLYSVLKKYAALSNLELVDLHSAELMAALNSNYESISALAYDDYGLTYVQKVLKKYNTDAVKAIADAKAELETAKAQTAEARAMLEEAKTLVKTYDENKAKLDAELANYLGTADYALAKQYIAMFGDPTGGKLTQAIAYVEDYADDVETARGYIAEYEPQLEAAEKEIAEAEAYLNNAETVLLPQLVEVESALGTLITALKKFATTVEPAQNCASWNVVDKDILRDDLASSQYTKLNNWLNALENTKLFKNADVEEKLYVASKEVQYNMSMFDVNIELTVYKLDGTVGSNNLIEGEKVVGKVTLTDGASRAEIQAAIDAANIKASADLTYYGEPVVSALPDALSEDITYTIKYYPNSYTYTIMDGGNELVSDTVYYGYKLRLPAYTGTENQVYEYKVNSTVYTQGQIFTVTDDVTIARVQGKPRTVVLIKDMLANNLSSGMTSNGAEFGLSNEAVAVLKSAALISGDIKLRIPGEDAYVAFVGDKVVSNTYASDLGGLYWVPVAAEYVAENGKVVDTIPMVNGEADLSSKDYAKVVIRYELVVESSAVDSAVLLNMLNMPHTLVNEYVAQAEALEILNNKYGPLGQLDSSKVGMLVAATKDMDPEIYQAALAIQQNCMDGEQLALYNLLTGYRAEGMAYYYVNDEAFVKQAGLLTDALNTLWGDLDNRNALLDVMYEYADILSMSKEEIDGYVEPLGQLLDALQGMDLLPHNAAIDVDSDELPALVAAIAAAKGNTQKYNALSETPALYIAPVSKDAPDYVSVNVQFYIDGKLIVLPESVLSSLAFRLDKSTNSYIVKTEDAAAIQKLIADALNAVQAGNAYDLNAFYTVNITGEVPVKDSVLTGAVTITYNYTAKEYAVNVEGTAQQTISVGSTLKVNLPAGSSLMRYEYIIDGQTVPAGSYTFTAEQIERLFVNGAYNVERVETKLNPVGDKLQGVVDGMNGDIAVDLEITENADGTYSYVMNMVVPTTVMSNPNAMSQVGMALFGGYTYIEMNGKVLLDGTKMYAQTLLDGILNSGMSSETLMEVAANNGGKLMSFELTMGASSEDPNMVTTTLNVYMSGDSAELDTLADRIAYFENYVKISCVDGGLVMDLTLPEKAYQAYLAAMLVLDQRDLKDINDIDGKVALGYMLDVIDPVLTDETLTLKTFTNTLALLGYDINADKFEPYFQRMLDAYNSLQWNYDENGIATSLTGREKAVNLLKEKVGALGGMIADDEITAKITLNVTNLQKDYEAVFADVRAAGISNKVGLTTDLAGKKLAGEAVVVLLSDVGSAKAPVTLNFNDLTVIDLNGYTIYGDVNCKAGSVYIIDSSVADAEAGRITGNITGNVKITAGTYAKDITANLVDGYLQSSNGCVKNTYYSIDKDAADNYTITLNPDAVNVNQLPDIKALALDILFDLIVNGYDKGAMWINGFQVYDIVIENVVDIYTSDSKLDAMLSTVVNGTANQAPWFNVSELAELYNVLVADLTNFDNIANGEYLAQYEIATAPWEISVFVDGDHISGGVGALGGATEKHTVTIVLGEGSRTNSIKDLAAELDKVVTVESNLEMSQNKHGSTIRFDANYNKSSVVIDLTGDNNYIVMIGTLLADAVDNNAALIAGLEAYKNYGTTNALKSAIDNCTVSDVLTALANIDRGYDFSEFGKLGDTYGEVLKLVGAVIRKLDIADRGSRKLGSFESDDYAAYVLDKENISLSKSITKRGYTVTVNAKAPLVSVTLLLCNACQHSNPIYVPEKYPNCTDDGNIAYWYCESCNTCFEDEACTRVIAKEDTVIPATGHNYTVDWTWAEDYSSAIATFTCTNTNCPDSIGYAKDDEIDSEITGKPSCDQAGTVVYTASVVFKGVTYTDVQSDKIAKLDHVYTTAPIAWAWAADYSSATATFICDNCGDEIEVAARVTKSTIGATCTVDGKIVYTAAVSDSNDVQYTDSKEEPIIAEGHKYEVTWSWAADYSSATATFTCANCEEVHDVLNAAVTDNGKGVYVGTVTYEGVVYVDVQTVNHNFVLDGWTWAADYSGATANFTCAICGEPLAVNVISTSVTVDATCTVAGSITYTVTLTLDGVPYTDTKVIPYGTAQHNLTYVAKQGATCTVDGNIAYWYCDACGKYFADAAATQEITKADTVITAGHKYTGEPTWAWSEDNSNAVAKFTCDVCGESCYVETATTSKTDDPSCTENGKTVYTAQVTFGGNLYTGTKEVSIPATGHTYAQLGDFVWAADYSSATVTIQCNCGDTQVIDAVVTSKRTEPTFEANGQILYTAIAGYNGQVFRDTAVEPLYYQLSIDSVAVGTDDKIVGTKVTADNFIYLDLQPSGVTADELLALLNVQYKADKLTLTLTNSKEGSGLVCNGSTLTITATNNDGHSVSVSYVIIVLGDVNGNGRIEVADTHLIASTRVGTSSVELSRYALMAADVNMNGGLDVADASRNANKVVFWEDYTTRL